MGVFKPERTIELPTKDVLSWIFDDPHYDKDEPVCWIVPRILKAFQLIDSRYILTSKTLQDQFPQIKLVSSFGSWLQDFMLRVWRKVIVFASTPSMMYENWLGFHFILLNFCNRFIIPCCFSQLLVQVGFSRDRIQRESSALYDITSFPLAELRSEQPGDPKPHMHGCLVILILIPGGPCN